MNYRSPVVHVPFQAYAVWCFSSNGARKLDGSFCRRLIFITGMEATKVIGNFNKSKPNVDLLIAGGFCFSGVFTHPPGRKPDAGD
jgi:hypothetical protein